VTKASFGGQQWQLSGWDDTEIDFGIIECDSQKRDVPDGALQF
jgi:hypothetical protein